MSAAPSDERSVERRRCGTACRRPAILLVIGVGAFGVLDLPVEVAAAPSGGTTLTRRYDPAAAVTEFTLDIAKTSGGALVLATCPGVRMLRTDGPRGATVIDAPSGTTASFPSKAAGTYRVLVAGDMADLGVGQRPGGCGGYAVTSDPAVATRAGVELGPSTRIAKHP